MAPVGHEGGVHQFGVGVERQHGTCLLRLSARGHQVHVGPFCGQIGKLPVLQVGGRAVHHAAEERGERAGIRGGFGGGGRIGHPRRQVHGDFVAKLVLGIVAIARGLLGHGVGTVAVELAGGAYLGGEVHGDAPLVVWCGLGEQVEVGHPSILGQHTQIGRHVGRARHVVHPRELVAAVTLGRGQGGGRAGGPGRTAGRGTGKVHRAVLEHGRVVALDHPLDKGTGRIGRAVVFALVTNAARPLYLAVYSVESRLLEPYLKGGFLYLHGLLAVVGYLLQR